MLQTQKLRASLFSFHYRKHWHACLLQTSDHTLQLQRCRPDKTWRTDRHRQTDMDRWTEMIVIPIYLPPPLTSLWGIDTHNKNCISFELQHRTETLNTCCVYYNAFLSTPLHPSSLLSNNIFHAVLLISMYTGGDIGGYVCVCICMCVYPVVVVVTLLSLCEYARKF